MVLFANHIRDLPRSSTQNYLMRGNICSATRKATTSTGSCLKFLTVNRRVQMYSRLVEATSTRRPICRNEQ
jgi:hypothetical protein